jgi:hypothetical protein
MRTGTARETEDRPASSAVRPCVGNAFNNIASRFGASDSLRIYSVAGIAATSNATGRQGISTRPTIPATMVAARSECVAVLMIASPAQTAKRIGHFLSTGRRPQRQQSLTVDAQSFSQIL